MSRPKLTTPVHEFRTTIRLREGEDDDLLSFFQQFPPRRIAPTLVAALRQGSVAGQQAELAADDEAWEAALEGMLF